MPHIPTLEPESAPKEVVEVYLDFQRRMGFPAPPNFIKTQGHSLAAARGTWGVVQNVLAVSMSALAVYANIIADATGMPADEFMNF